MQFLITYLCFLLYNIDKSIITESNVKIIQIFFKYFVIIRWIVDYIPNVFHFEGLKCRSFGHPHFVKKVNVVQPCRVFFGWRRTARRESAVSRQWSLALRTQRPCEPPITRINRPLHSATNWIFSAKLPLGKRIEKNHSSVLSVCSQQLFDVIVLFYLFLTIFNSIIYVMLCWILAWCNIVMCK